MNIIVNNVKIIEIGKKFLWGANDDIAGTFTIKSMVEVNTKPMEVKYFVKTFNYKVIAGIEEAFKNNKLVKLMGHMSYSRYAPKNVINVVTNKQYSHAQWDYIIESVEILEASSTFGDDSGNNNSIGEQNVSERENKINTETNGGFYAGPTVDISTNYHE